MVPQRHCIWKHLGKDDEVVEAFEKARQNDPHNISLLFSEGNALFGSQSMTKLFIFLILHSIKILIMERSCEKGRALAKLGRDEEAQEIFGFASAHLPNRYEPPYLQGLSLVLLGRFEELDMHLMQRSR